MDNVGWSQRIYVYMPVRYWSLIPIAVEYKKV